MIWTENAPDIARFVVSISDTIKSNQIKLAKLSCLTSVKEYGIARENKNFLFERNVTDRYSNET